MELTIFYYLNFTNIYLHQHSINVCLSKYFFSQFFSKKLGEFKFNIWAQLFERQLVLAQG